CPLRAQTPLAPSVPHHRLPCVGLRRAPALGRCAATWTPPLVPERAPGAAGLHGSAVTEELLYPRPIILGPGGGARVRKNTLACQLGPDQRDIPMNHGVEDLGATTLPQEGSDVGGERRPRIEFRQQDVWCLERQRHLLPQTGDGVQQLVHPFDREGP